MSHDVSMSMPRNPSVSMLRPIIGVPSSTIGKCYNSCSLPVLENGDSALSRVSTPGLGVKPKELRRAKAQPGS